MKTLGYYNGKFGPLEEMTVPMNDRACYFGDGVYEATLARNGKIFALKDHLDRFFNSAGLIKIDIPYTKDELAAILYDMLAKMDDKDIFIYWQMTRGTGIRQHQFPEKGTKPNLWIFMKPGKPADSSKRLKLTDMEDTRFLHCNIKTLNLLVNVMAAEKAESSDAANVSSTAAISSLSAPTATSPSSRTAYLRPTRQTTIFYRESQECTSSRSARITESSSTRHHLPWQNSWMPTRSLSPAPQNSAPRPAR